MRIMILKYYTMKVFYQMHSSTDYKRIFSYYVSKLMQVMNIIYTIVLL